MLFASFCSSRARRRIFASTFSIGALGFCLSVGQAQQADRAVPPLSSTHSAAAAATTTSRAANTSLVYTSVFSSYKPMTDQKLGNWRDANDTVTRIGGWRTYLKEAQTPDIVVPPTQTTNPTGSVLPIPAKPPTHHGSKP
jgi:hypothetical protein